jgi:hypothetical protein
MMARRVLGYSGEKEMASAESPRVVIESSVLVVTLLFVITQLGPFSDKSLVIGSVAAIGSIFILAAIFAAMALGDVLPRAAQGFLQLSLIFFLLGLVMLWGLLVIMGIGFGLGERFGYASFGLLLAAVAAGFLFTVHAARQKPKKKESETLTEP